ncbi:MAG: hypothetical protein EPO31_13455 [Gammaproteobacteria bacterium]|nr:MAG: hypothetical protein EPO31_13455 [Gammaproteobacteria bacterium]
MNETVLLADVGGTNTRIRVIQLAPDMLRSPRVILNRTARVSRKQSFLGYLGETIDELERQPRQAVFCCAGPMTDVSVSMTNWEGVPDLHLAELAECGLPVDHTVMVNDMEAAAASVAAHHRKLAEIDLMTLAPGDGQQAGRRKNSVILMPGTGTGVAGVLEDPIPGRGRRLVTVSCELQHTPIPELDAEQAAVLAALRDEIPGGRPSWEDFISGRGLERIYACLGRHAAHDAESVEVMSAAAIANRAGAKDVLCRAALEIFYRCAGSLAQLLALGFQAFGGVFLAGESTRQNLALIRESGFLRAFHENPVRADWLKIFPVYMTTTDVNLAGAAMIAAEYAGLIDDL